MLCIAVRTSVRGRGARATDRAHYRRGCCPLLLVVLSRPQSTEPQRQDASLVLFGWHPSSRSACDASPNLLCPCWLAGSPRTSRKQAAQHHVIPELPTTEPVNVCCLALAAMIRRQGARDKTGTESYKQRRCQAPTVVSQSEQQESTRGSGQISFSEEW
jgi:hypothetical protein